VDLIPPNTPLLREMSAIMGKKDIVKLFNIEQFFLEMDLMKLIFTFSSQFEEVQQMKNKVKNPPPSCVML
jgi:hypothetical protein